MDKRKNVLENLLKDWGQAGFFMFSHWQHKIFVAETKKIRTDLIFFFASATKNFRKKVAKQRNLTWGHAKEFIGDCKIFRFLLLPHKKCFCVPLA